MNFLPELSTPTVVDSCRGISVTEDFLGISTGFSIGTLIEVVLGDGLGEVLEVVGGTTIFDLSFRGTGGGASVFVEIFTITLDLD